MNKCITQPQPEQQIRISGENFVDSPTVAGDQPVHYNFDYLEDKDGRVSHKQHGNHILLWMVSRNIVMDVGLRDKWSFKPHIVILYSFMCFLVTTYKYIL